MKKLILMGYWHNDDEMGWPDPGRFVDPTWNSEIKARVIKYLMAGKTVRRFCGTSWCRFRCRQFGHFSLGSAELTDDVYIWPQGLQHYLSEHSVRLPDEFVAHVLRRMSMQTRAEALARLESNSVEEWGDFDDEIEYLTSEINVDWWRLQKGFSEGKSFLSPTPRGDVIALLPSLPASEAIRSLIRRFISYETISSVQLLQMLRAGSEITLTTEMHYWDFVDLATEAAQLGLELKFVTDNNE